MSEPGGDGIQELKAKLDEVKNQFVSIASHELRTPIAVIHGIAANTPSASSPASTWSPIPTHSSE